MRGARSVARPAASASRASTGVGQNGSSDPPTSVATAARPAGTSCRSSRSGAATFFALGAGAERARRSAALRRVVRGSSGATNASRSSVASRAAGGRLAGSTESADSTAASSRRGRSLRRADSGGAPDAIVEATCGIGTPQNGWLPARDSHSITPTAQMSLRSDASSPVSRSGEMYASVPGTSPTAVSVSASSNCARPKSSTRTATSPPPSSTSTFDGFTSRWTIPRRCACARPSSTWAAISTASASLSRRARSSSRSVRPRTYSYAMYTCPASPPKSYARTQRSCRSRVAASISRDARAARLPSRGTILSATSRPVRSSRASHTDPEPPLPRGLSGR